LPHKVLPSRETWIGATPITLTSCHSQTKPLRKQVKRKKNPKPTHQLQKKIAQSKMDGQGASKYLIDNYSHVIF
jgi:hypothetical protein